MLEVYYFMKHLQHKSTNNFCRSSKSISAPVIRKNSVSRTLFSSSFKYSVGICDTTRLLVVVVNDRSTYRNNAVVLIFSHYENQQFLQW